MPLIPCRCAQCGAELQVDSEREFMFCQYCGSKVFIDNNKKITFVDQAKVEEIESRREFNNRRLEIEEQRRKEVKEEIARKKKKFKKGIFISLAVFVVCIIIIAICPDIKGTTFASAMICILLASLLSAMFFLSFLILLHEKEVEMWKN